ncbi:35669_t:CDS:2, partial [Racocetra persica]
SKLKIEDNIFGTSSRNNDILSQPEVILISDTDNKPVLKSTSNSFIQYYEDFHISSSFESEYNSNNSLNDCISMNNLNNNDILENNLKNDDNDNDILENRLENKDSYEEYPKTSLTSIASIYKVSDWDSDDAKNTFGISNLQYAYGNPGTI